MSGPAYRASQFFRTLLLSPTPYELERALDALPPPLHPLFLSMPRADQLHALRVYGDLLDRGQRDAILLQAALLHDVGKALHRPRLWERVLIVLGQRLAPRLCARLGRGDPRGWRRAFVIARQHPQWGAELIRQKGGAEKLIRLVQHHQEPANRLDDFPYLDELLALQGADGRN